MSVQPSRPPYAVLVAVGPGPQEIDRLRDLIDSIACHEPGHATLVMVDDADVPRDLDQIARPDNLSLASVHHRRAGRDRVFAKGKGICSVILTGLRWAQANTNARFVIKVDTDSLIIGPFRDHLMRCIAAHPGVGMIGAYERTPMGGRRDWSMHESPIRVLRRGWSWRTLLRRADQAPAAARRHVRSVLRQADRHGYRSGEHCLGGGYAVTRSLLDAAAEARFLAAPELWAAVDLPEDVAVGMHVRALGQGFLDDVDENGVFGVRHIGLAYPPQELLDRRYAIIHAVKNDAHIDEDSIRAFFRERR